MPARVLKVMVVLLSVVLLCPAVVLAQFDAWGSGTLAQSPPRETILGVGTVSVKCPPSALRMYVELLAKGKTLEEALDNLKDCREAATVQLEALKADRESIEFGAPSLSNPQSEQRRRFEAMVRERMRVRGRKPPKGLQVPKSFTVSATLTAQWPLEADSPEKLLLAAQSLQEKVKAANLAGTQQPEELSPEEEELAEEMAEMMSMTGEEQIEPGTPCFVYVARITEADRDQAMAQAFQKAKAHAGRLAQAAGTGLGPLVGLSGQGGGRTSYSEGIYGYEYRNYLQRLMGRGEFPSLTETSEEALSSNPGSLEFVFYVRAIFSLQQP